MDKNDKKKYKQLQAPKYRILYTEPLNDILLDKKIKLETEKEAFLFFICKARPDIIFLQYKGLLKIDKILKQYTKEEKLKEQFITLLKQPRIIINNTITILILEAIFISYKLLELDLTTYIKYICFNNLYYYYIIKCKLDC